jgi:hypothetical protein
MSSLFRVRTVFTGVQGSPWLSTMYFDNGAGTAQQAATAVGVFWGTIDNRMATSVLWSTEAEVVLIDDATGDPTAVVTTTPSSGAGSGAATMLPVVAQGLVRWRTGVFSGGREVRGRTFVPGLTENDNDLGVPNGSIIPVVDGAAAALVATANADLVIYSRTKSLSESVTSGSMWTSWAELKSRRD